MTRATTARKTNECELCGYPTTRMVVVHGLKCCADCAGLT
jgi:hypothetical protein